MKTKKINNDNLKQSVPAILQDSVNKIMINENIINYVADYKRVSANGGSYLGDLYTVTVKIHKENGCKKLHLFAKINTSNEDIHGSVVPIKELYKSENFVYTDLNYVITKIQIEENVPHGERFNMVPFYITGYKDAIIMDDMTKNGYRVFDRLKVLSLQYAESALKTLAKFHSLSFVLQNKHPSFYENHIKPRRIVCNLNKDYEVFLEKVFGAAINVLDSEDVKKKFKLFSKDVMKKLKQLAMETNVKVRTLCHGDFRVNNILIREADGNISDMIIIDYQHLFYGNPVKDILFLLFGATDQEFRKKYLYHLRDHYYNSLHEFLGYFHMKSEESYPRKQFETDFNERLDYGLVVVIQTLPFVFASESKAPNIKDDGFSNVIVDTDNKIYKERVNDLVDEGIKWGIL